MSARLALVAHRPRTPENLLAEMVPELIAAEAVVASLKALVDEQGRALARQRGVAFIRPEAIRREFGGGRG